MADEHEGLEQEGTPETGTETEAESQPEWFMADRFGSRDEQARAYSEAEKRMNDALAERDRERRERERIEQERDELAELAQQAPQQQQFQDPNQNPFVLAYQRAVEDGDIAAQLAIHAQLTDTVVAQRLEAQAKSTPQDTRGLDPYLVGEMRDSIAAKYEADETIQAKALEIMETHPVVSRSLQAISDDPQATIGDLAPVVDTAYQLAKAGAVAQENQSLAQKQMEAESARQRKIDQESLSGSGPTRVASKSEQEKTWEAIMGADTGEFRVGQQ